MDFALKCLESRLSPLEPFFENHAPPPDRPLPVSIYAPFRLLIAAAAALLIATAIASSSAHALLLGDAVAQSGLGMPRPENRWIPRASASSRPPPASVRR